MGRSLSVHAGKTYEAQVHIRTPDLNIVESIPASSHSTMISLGSIIDETSCECVNFVILVPFFYLFTSTQSIH